MTSKEHKETEKYPVPAELLEKCFELNFSSRKTDEILFSNLCLSSIDTWLNDLKITKEKELSDSEKLVILSVTKARRLLRSIQLLINSGQLPETIPLFRTLLENSILLAYILNDKTGKRITKYFSFTSPKQKWSFKLMSEEIIGKKIEGAYTDLSLYCHPHILGFSKIFHGKHIQRSAISDFDNAAEKLIQASVCAVGIVETANCVIPPSESWDAIHNQILNSKFLQTDFKKVKKLIEEGDQDFCNLISQRYSLKNNI